MLDLNKPVQTRDGRKARIICTDRKPYIGHQNSLVALVTEKNGAEVAYTFLASGRAHESHDCHIDLVNVPAKLLVNIYKYSDGRFGVDGFSKVELANARKHSPWFHKQIEVEV